MTAKRDTRQDDVLVLTELDQLRALADPLRSRILTVLCQAERTTKQVADELGEKPTKLYHHVETLERAGLVRMTRTRQNRGTLEKYFIGVARRFEAGPSLLGTAPDAEAAEEGRNALTAMVETILDQTRTECGRLASGDGRALQELEKEGLFTFAEIHADQPDVDRLLRRLRRLLSDLSKRQDEAAPDATYDRSYRLMFACYPLDRFPDEE